MASEANQPPVATTPLLHPVGRALPLSSAQAAANELRAAILASPEDDVLLGSEQQLIERLGVSRATLRQAARIVEAEGLLTVRRGAGGGMFGRRPTTGAVTHMASIVLRSNGTTFVDIMSVLYVVVPTALGQAATNPDLAARERLVATAHELCDMAASDFDPVAYAALRLRWLREVADLCTNPALGLFIRVLGDLAGSRAGTPQHVDVGYVRSEAALQLRVSQAIVEGDADVARTVAVGTIARLVEETPLTRVDGVSELQ